MRSLFALILISLASESAHAQHSTSLFDRKIEVLNQQLRKLQDRIKHLDLELKEIEAASAKDLL
ncbi:MAG: hypothetical protein ACE361_20165 [Aureliella sp.]